MTSMKVQNDRFKGYRHKDSLRGVPTLNQWDAELGKKIDRATLRHITPVGFEHIISTAC
jgi:hypothetical protein